MNFKIMKKVGVDRPLTALRSEINKLYCYDKNVYIERIQCLRNLNTPLMFIANISLLTWSLLSQKTTLNINSSNSYVVSLKNTTYYC